MLTESINSQIFLWTVPTILQPWTHAVSPSSMAFLTALRPSLMASLICVRVCLLGPFTSSVTERGFPHFSMNVYFSSPWEPERGHFNNLTSERMRNQTDSSWGNSPVCVRTPAQRVPGTRVWGRPLSSWPRRHRRGRACRGSSRRVSFESQTWFMLELVQ